MHKLSMFIFHIQLHSPFRLIYVNYTSNNFQSDADLSSVHNMTLGLMFLSIKIVLLHRQEHSCSSELLRYNASDTRIEIKSIPAFQCNIIMSYCEPGFRLMIRTDSGLSGNCRNTGLISVCIR